MSNPNFDSEPASSPGAPRVFYPRTIADAMFGDIMRLTDGADDNLVGLARHEPRPEVQLSVEILPMITFPRTAGDIAARDRSELAWKRFFRD